MTAINSRPDSQSVVETIVENCLGKNRALPSDCYIDEGYLQLEEQLIFRDSWMCLGRADEIPAVGDYFTSSLLSEPLVVVRSDPSTVSVYANVCQHRAMQVANGAGNTRQFVCPYHAWTYALDGKLRSAPLMEDKASLKGCRLPVIRSECWGGFIFATLNEAAESLESQLSELQEAIEHYQMEGMHHISCFHETWDCNWKSLIENFMDGYHLSVVHPQTLRPLTPTNLCQTMSSNGAYTGYIANYALAAPERLNHSALLTADERRQSRLFCIYPSVVVSVSPDTLVYLSMQPDGVDKVSVKWGLSSFEKDLDEEQKDQRIKKWQEINREDHNILKCLQRGLRSSFYQGGQLAPADLEGSVKNFHDYLIRKLAQGLAAVEGVG